jgi:hypothetical protein
VRRWPTDHKRVGLLFLLTVVLLLAGVRLFGKAKTTPFHGDESGWISTGYYYTDLLLSHDFVWEKWECSSCGNWGSWLTMPLGKWLIGLPLRLNPGTSNQSFFRFYWFGHSRAWNEAEGNIPPQSILLPGRRASAVFGAFCCVLVFLIGFRCYNWLIGGMAVIFLLTNRLFIESATRAMTDIHYEVFLLAECLAASLLLNSGKRSRTMLVASLCGLLAGLAGLVKESGVVLGGLVFVAVTGYKALLTKVEKRELLPYLAIFSFSATAVIYLVNPYFWPSIKEIDTKALSLEMREFFTTARNSEARTESLRQAFPQLSNIANVLRFPKQFVNRNDHMRNDPTFGQWEGGRFVAIHQKLLTTLSDHPAAWVLLIIGIFAYAQQTVTHGRSRRITLRSVPLLYFLVNYLFLLFFVRLNWERYYIPTLVAGALIVAGGTFELVLAPYHIAHRWKSHILRS